MDTSHDDVLAQTENERICAIFLERLSVRVKCIKERIEFSNPNSLHEQKVCVQRLFESWLTEDGPFRNIPHEKLNDNIELVGSLNEPGGSSSLGGFADSSHKLVVRGGIVKLNSTDTAKIVLVTRNEVIGCRLREHSL